MIKKDKKSKKKRRKLEKNVKYIIIVDGGQKYCAKRGNKTMNKRFKKLTTTISVALLTAGLVMGNVVSANAAIYEQYSPIGEVKKSVAYKNYGEFFGDVELSSNKSFVVPGLSSDMVPQGMCEVGNYILISAYDSTKSKNSCIHVIDKQTGKQVKTLYIKGSKTHVGGLTYDGNYVWLANSGGKNVGRIKASNITGSNVKDGATISFEFFSTKDLKGNKITASFATYYQNTLWVGQFNETGDSYVYGYSVGKSPLTVKYSVKIPKKIQGMAFLSDGRVVLSQSYGRNNDSKILVYNKPSYSSKNGVQHATLSNAAKTIKAPPMTENIHVGSDGLVYVLFESGAKYYYKDANNRGKAPVDRVLALRVK